MDITALTLCEVRDKIASGFFSATEVLKATIERIEKNKDLNAFITLDYEGAKAEAKRAEERLSRGESPLLNGVPILIKDNIVTKGLRTTCASQMLENFIPPYDATVVERLRSAGAVIIGKTNMDEFAMGSSSEHSAFGAVKNPLNPEVVAGGSSGGSAVGVLARLGYGALGSDTGGSIRQPSAFCGVVGMKPTYSSVSRYGLIAHASSLDQIGPITRTVRDNAELLSVIAGKDDKDATSVKTETDYYRYEKALKGKTIGIPKEFFTVSCDKSVKNAMAKALKFYASKGVTIKEVSIPSFSSALSSYYVIACAESASNLARYDGIRYGKRAEGKSAIDTFYQTRTEYFGTEVKRRIMLGNFVLQGADYDRYYLKACAIRKKLKAELDEILSECDALIGPTTPTTAFKRGTKNSCSDGSEDIYTVLASLTGNPAISVPCGADENGLPIGMQLIGKNYDEKTLYSFAQVFEEEGKE